MSPSAKVTDSGGPEARVMFQTVSYGLSQSCLDNQNHRSYVSGKRLMPSWGLSEICGAGGPAGWTDCRLLPEGALGVGSQGAEPMG